MVKKKKDIEVRGTERVRPLGCRLGKKKRLGAESSVCSEQLGVSGGPRGLVKQQGKNVLDAQMVY